MSLRKALLRGETVIGTFVQIPHPVVIELVGGLGFDFLMIDAEHSLIDRVDIGHFARAADNVRAPLIFRIPSANGEWVASALDAGAAGVVVPRVETVEQARAMVDAMRYPPLGSRGLGPGRALSYGYGLGDHVATANDDLLLAIQIETVTGLENVEAICGVAGIDAVYIGTADLSMSLGVWGSGDATLLDGAISRIADACIVNNIAAGSYLKDVDALKRSRAWDMRFVTVSSDMMMLKDAAMSAIVAIRAA